MMTGPIELVATIKVPIVGMTTYKDRLIVATSEGAFERGPDGAFHEIPFVPTSQPKSGPMVSMERKPSLEARIAALEEQVAALRAHLVV